MTAPAHRRLEVYLPNALVEELGAEAARQDRDLSWMMCRAWELARGRLAELPCAPQQVAREQARHLMALERAGASCAAAEEA